MSARPSRTPSLPFRLFRGAGVAIALLALFVLGLTLNSTGVDRESPLLIGLGVLLSLASFIAGLILGLRPVARWERRCTAEAVAYADQLVCSACGVFPRDKGIARPQSRVRAAVNVIFGVAVALVIANALLTGLNRQSLLGAVGVILLGRAASRWAATPRFVCPTCKGDSVVSRQSAKGARWAAAFEGPRAVE